MKVNKNYIFIGLTVFCIILFSVWNISQKNGDKSVNRIASATENSVDLTTQELREEPTENNTNTADIIKVHITGCVQNPGVYEMGNGERVEDVLNRAGGFTEEADSTAVNLAEYIFDTQQIIIPSLNAPNNNSLSNDNINDTSIKKVNINTASKEELMKLSGIGDAISQYIIQYRDTKGPFETIEDIKKVPKIGASIFDMIKEQIVVE